jgi:hypothetical protein
MKNLQVQATNVLKAFERKTREDGTNYYTCSNEDIKNNLVKACHDNCHILPNDWIYNTIVDCLDLISDYDDVDSITLEPDCYNNDLFTWFDSYPKAVELFDKVILEQPSTARNGFYEIVAMAQVEAMQGILDNCISYLESLEEVEV